MNIYTQLIRNVTFQLANCIIGEKTAQVTKNTSVHMKSYRFFGQRVAQTCLVVTMHLPRWSESWGSPRRAGRRAMAGLCGWCGQSLQGWWKAAHGPCVREGTPRSDVCERRTGWSGGRSEPAGSRRHIMLLAKTHSFQEYGRRVKTINHFRHAGSSPCRILCHLKLHSSAVCIKGFQN
jgi:hypothetical protein